MIASRPIRVWCARGNNAGPLWQAPGARLRCWLSGTKHHRLQRAPRPIVAHSGRRSARSTTPMSRTEREGLLIVTAEATDAAPPEEDVRCHVDGRAFVAPASRGDLR
jgi:hypothetical protein